MKLFYHRLFLTFILFMGSSLPIQAAFPIPTIEIPPNHQMIAKKGAQLIKSLLNLKDACTKETCTRFHIDDAVTHIALDFIIPTLKEQLSYQSAIGDIPLVQHGIVMGLTAKKILYLKPFSKTPENWHQKYTEWTAFTQDLHQATLITKLPKTAFDVLSLATIAGTSIYADQSNSLAPFQQNHVLHRAAQAHILLNPSSLGEYAGTPNRLRQSMLAFMLTGYGVIETYFERKNSPELFNNQNLSNRILNLMTLFHLLDRKIIASSQ